MLLDLGLPLHGVMFKMMTVYKERTGNEDVIAGCFDLTIKTIISSKVYHLPST